ncbi:extensin-like [Benincasa hispida]|uniref:extensin-like n=1 Tax=Benincasa hispida TaxID=102211 RepID=UPI0019013ADA|nr:extensin-like [Benincasa hispida]
MSSTSDSQNQTMSFGNNSPISSYSSSSISISPPPSPRKTTKTLTQTKPTHGGATSSQRSSVSKPSTAPTKLPFKASKAIITPPAKIPQPKPKTPQPKPKTTPKLRAKTPAKPRMHSSSTATSRPYTKLAPPPVIPNITMVGATHNPLPAYIHNALSPAVHPPSPLSIKPLATIYPVESDASSQPPHSPIFISSPGMPNITMVGATHNPLLAYIHNAPSPAVHPPPPLSIEPLATIYPVESDASSQPPHSPILISSPGMPHTLVGTPPFTPFTPPSDNPASERNLEELAELARLDEQEVFGAILASLNQSQEEEKVICSDPPNTSLELDEVE